MVLLGFGSVDSNGAVDTDCNGDGDGVNIRIDAGVGINVKCKCNIYGDGAVCFGVDVDGNINGRIDDGFDYDVVDTV